MYYKECRKCATTFTTKRGLNIHTKSIHKKIRHGLKLKHKLNSHKKCPWQNKGQCVFCVWILFLYCFGLKTTHETVEDFLWKQCGEMFSQKGHMNTHVRGVIKMSINLSANNVLPVQYKLYIYELMQMQLISGEETSGANFATTQQLANKILTTTLRKSTTTFETRNARMWN